MERSAAVAALAAVVGLCGCASTPAEIATRAQQKSSYSLCESLVVEKFASQTAREIWATELQRRGDSCNAYMPAIQARQAGYQQLYQNGMQMMQPPAQYAPSGGMVCNHTSNWISGSYRTCAYNCAGSTVYESVPSASLCPITVSR